MTVSKDPNELAKIPDGMLEEAKRTGLHVLVISVSNNSRFAQFFAMTPIRPNIGDHIVTEDNTYCIVKNVIFSIVSTTVGHRLVPNIFAEALEDQITPLKD